MFKQKKTQRNFPHLLIYYSKPFLLSAIGNNLGENAERLKEYDILIFFSQLMLRNLSKTDLERFLLTLARDRVQGAEKYIALRERLEKFFEWRDFENAGV